MTDWPPVAVGNTTMSEKSDSNTSGERTDSETNYTVEYGPEPWKNPKRLRDLYVEKGWSQYEIADHFDVKQPTIAYWMDKLEIESRPPMHEWDARKLYRTAGLKGKHQYKVREPEDAEKDFQQFYEHEIVALLEFEASEVFADDTVIHHAMNSPHGVDLPENLDVLGAREHVQLHAGGGGTAHPRIVLQEVFDEEDPLSEERMQAAKIRHWKSRFESSNGVVADD